MPVRAPANVGRAIVLHRSSRDFTDRDKAFARAVQPLLASAHSHAAHLRRGLTSAKQDRPGAAVERADAYRLTPREMAVLTLLADALTAAAIGRRLGIATRTVHKHIGSIYRKLGTTDRLATVLCAQRSGLIPGPPTR